MSGPLLDADYTAIEARIVCWLTGQDDAIAEYKAQDAATDPEEKKRLDRYRIMASEIYGIPIDEVNKHPQRFVGKQAILLLGFQGAGPKFRSTCWKMGRYKLPLGLEDIAVNTFRKKHHRIKGYWPDVERAAQTAIAQKGKIVPVSNKLTGPYKVPVSFLHEEISGIPFLLCKLPSGRKLAYPRPRLVPSPKFEGKLAIKFFGNIIGKTWGDCDTYGGSLLENITQAVAADIMCQGAYNAEEDGFPIAALIHDQALSYSLPGLTVPRFVGCLTDMPAWADGLPLEAEGGEVPWYKKD